MVKIGGCLGDVKKLLWASPIAGSLFCKKKCPLFKNSQKKSRYVTQGPGCTKDAEPAQIGWNCTLHTAVRRVIGI